MDTSLFVFSPVYVVFAIPIIALIVTELLRSSIADRRRHHHPHHQNHHHHAA